MSGLGLKVYYDLMSQPSRAVILFLKANRIPFTPKPVALRKGFQFAIVIRQTNTLHHVYFRKELKIASADVTKPRPSLHFYRVTLCNLAIIVT